MNALDALNESAILNPEFEAVRMAGPLTRKIKSRRSWKPCRCGSDFLKLVSVAFKPTLCSDVSEVWLLWIQRLTDVLSFLQVYEQLQQQEISKQAKMYREQAALNLQAAEFTAQQEECR
jgi:hypothetical protein